MAIGTVTTHGCYRDCFACACFSLIFQRLAGGILQIRSHAQKYFWKVQKNGKTEHVPPSRPKREASHPYPQKTPKNVSAVSHATGALKSSSALLDSGHAARLDPLLGSRNPVCSAQLSLWTYSVAPTGSISHTSKDDTEAVGFTLSQNCTSSNNDSTLRTWKSDNINYQGKGNQCKTVRDFDVDEESFN